MSRFHVVLLMVAAFLAGGLLMNGLHLQAEEKAEPPFKGTLYFKWKELGLTKEQTQQVYKVQTEYRGRIAKLEAEIKKLKTEERAEAEKVLTPAQKARLKELLTGETAPKDKPKDDVKPKDK